MAKVFFVVNIPLEERDLLPDAHDNSFSELSTDFHLKTEPQKLDTAEDQESGKCSSLTEKSEENVEVIKPKSLENLFGKNEDSVFKEEDAGAQSVEQLDNGTSVDGSNSDESDKSNLKDDKNPELEEATVSDNQDEQKENVNEKEENVNEKKENVNEKKENANEKKEKVNEKEENVNEKKENVNEKKENANEKKEKVNEKKENVNEKKENWNEKKENWNEKKEANEESPSKKSDVKLVRILSHNEALTLREKVKATLEGLKIKGILWKFTEDNICVVMFVTDAGQECEQVLNNLSRLEIGLKRNSSISVFPASISVEDEGEDMEEIIARERRLEKKLVEFKKTIKTRLVVHELKMKTEKNAEFTFDFLMLLMLASLVAIMGLLEASSVVLVASMLISPLMGPILAGVFGAVVSEKKLARLGCKNEVYSLVLCVLVGFVSGFIPAGLESARADWRSTAEWPTLEMSSRGALRGLLVGVLIAVPSGAGVAFSILGNNVGSLIGVAISASLLPPAVNAGLLWANALVVLASPPATVQYQNLPANFSQGMASNISTQESDLCPSLKDNEYVHHYFCDMAAESAMLGLISLFLTVLNIGCIILTGILVLKTKEVKWKKGVQPFARKLEIQKESYQTSKGLDAAVLKQKWLEEYQKVKFDSGYVNKGNEDEEELDEMIEDIERSPDVVNLVGVLPDTGKRWTLHVDDKNENNSHNTFHGLSSLTQDSQPGDGEVELRNRGSHSAGATMGEPHDVPCAVHRFLPLSEAKRRSAVTFRSGRFLKHLAIPQTSRFVVAKVEEPEGGLTPGRDARRPSAASNVMRESEEVPLLSVRSISND